MLTLHLIGTGEIAQLCDGAFLLRKGAAADAVSGDTVLFAKLFNLSCGIGFCLCDLLFGEGFHFPNLLVRKSHGIPVTCVERCPVHFQVGFFSEERQIIQLFAIPLHLQRVQLLGRRFVEFYPVFAYISFVDINFLYIFFPELFVTHVKTAEIVDIFIYSQLVVHGHILHDYADFAFDIVAV